MKKNQVGAMVLILLLIFVVGCNTSTETEMSDAGVKVTEASETGVTETEETVTKVSESTSENSVSEQGTSDKTSERTTESNALSVLSEDKSEVQISTEPELSYIGDNMPRHAPNIYVTFSPQGSYDILAVDWCCLEDGNNTYYAVHNWSGGYAGFQNKNGEHKLLLSLWDTAGGAAPTIEYVLDGENGDFGGEGTGKHVFTNYDWKVGIWYSMRIQAWEADGKTYIGQWICESGGDWLKTAAISLPVTDFAFDQNSMFMEDFLFNNEPRSCALTNAFGREATTDTWESFQTWEVTNTYFPTYPPTWDDVMWNVNFDAGWQIAEDSSYVIVTSGGMDFSQNDCTPLPISYMMVQARGPQETSFLEP